MKQPMQLHVLALRALIMQTTTVNTLARSGGLCGGAPGPLARGPRAAAARARAVHALQRRRQPGHPPRLLRQGMPQSLQVTGRL